MEEEKWIAEWMIYILKELQWKFNTDIEFFHYSQKLVDDLECFLDKCYRLETQDGDL